MGDLFGAAGYRLVLVDKDRVLIDGLRRARSYRLVRLRGAGAPPDVSAVFDYTALHTGEEAQISSSIVRVSLYA